MNLAVSNLAWESKDLSSVLKILKDQKIKNIEGVISKISPWDDLSDDKLREFRLILSDYEIKIPSLQSIFFGTQISSLNEEKLVLEHFEKLKHISKVLGVSTLVFGSPNLRKKSNSNFVETFKKIDEVFDGENITLCIEPNTKIYGGDFFFTVNEIINFINLGKFKNIKTMIDTHNIILEDQDPIRILRNNFDYISHIHISEKKLSPIEDVKFHEDFSSELKQLKYDKIITYEVLPCDNIKKEIKLFTEIYG
jgi:sugar phosphate isomerase/epimerase